MQLHALNLSAPLTRRLSLTLCRATAKRALHHGGPVSRAPRSPLLGLGGGAAHSGRAATTWHRSAVSRAVCSASAAPPAEPPAQAGAPGFQRPLRIADLKARAVLQAAAL